MSEDIGLYFLYLSHQPYFRLTFNL